MKESELRVGLLNGREHHRLGELAVISEGRAAIALSKGGALKQYSHVDPNEDAVAFAIGEGGLIAAVADGHHGADAAEQAIAFAVSEIADRWTRGRTEATSPEDWERAGSDLLIGINQTILDTAQSRGLPASHTTFSLALARPGDDLLLCVSIGDSHIFRVREGQASDRGWQGDEHSSGAKARAFYLGYELPKARSLAGMSAVHCTALGDTGALVLATDGLSEDGIGVADPAAAVAAATISAAGEAADLRPLHACKAVATAALDAQRSQLAGDNIASAVLWLADFD